MKKKILTFALLLSKAGAIFAQSTADQFILPRHSIMTAFDFFGQSIAKNDNYVLVGSPDDDLRLPTDCEGRNQMTGAAVLYKDGKPLRAYTGKFTLAPGGTQEIGW